MKSAIKIKLNLNPEIQLILDSQSRIANWLYNHLLEHANQLRTEYIKNQDKIIGKILYTKTGLRDLIPNLKKRFNFLKTVYSSPLKNAGLRLSSAIQDYQRAKKGRSNKKKAGWPNFRSNRKKWFSLLYEEPWKGYKYKEGNIILSLGVDKNGKRMKLSLKLSEKFPDWFVQTELCEMRLVKQANNYYIIFTVNRIIKQNINIKRNIIAIDPNHKNLGYGVDTKKIATEIINPYFLKNMDKQIDAIKGRRDHCKRKSIKIKRDDSSYYWRPSRRWIFFNNKLQKLYQKRRDQIKT